MLMKMVVEFVIVVDILNAVKGGLIKWDSFTKQYKKLKML